MTSFTLPNLNGASFTADGWLQSSVQEFFSTLNWDDHPANSTVQSVQLSVEPLSLNASVSHFFAAFNWDGTTIAAATFVAQAEATDDKSFTLDDFSDLF